MSPALSAGGGVSGLVLFQFVGQTLTRLAVLKIVGVPASAVFSLSIYERLISLVLLGGLAISGAYQLFGQFGMDLGTGGSSLLVLIACGVGAGIFSLSFGFRPVMKEALGAIDGWAAVASLLSCMGITAVMYVFMLMAYIALSSALAPEIPTMDLAAASLVVMFAAALPISFGGWGVRELSAVYAFSFVGLSVENVVVVSLIIGGLSQLLLVGASGLLAAAPSSKKLDVANSGDGIFAAHDGFDFRRFLGWMLPVAISVGLLFQVRLPPGGQGISVNLADPVAIIGATYMIGHRFYGYWKPPYWRDVRFEQILIAMTAVFILSFLIGWQSFGFTSWAFFNRLVGWGILLCYVLSGAVAVLAFGSWGRHVTLRTFLSASRRHRGCSHRARGHPAGCCARTERFPSASI